MFNLDLITLDTFDHEIAKAINLEIGRQKYSLELIASENFVSPGVLAALGSVLTNKYAEGYPGKRYYGGCEYVDIAENLAIERAKKIFSTKDGEAEYANVQAHSGSQANMAVYFALLNCKDTVLAMDLANGGHLTHGSRISFSGKFFNFVHYGVKRDTGFIDYEQVAELADIHKPKLIVAGASAYPRTIDFKAFSEIAKSVGAFFMVDMAHIAGLVAKGQHPSPVPYADVVTSTTHKTLRGPRGGLIIGKKELGDKIDKEIFPGIQGGPLMHVIAAKAVAFKEAMEDSFAEYQKQIIKNANALANRLMENNINLVSGGTDTHIVFIDLRSLNITGKDGEKALEKAGITTNKNSIPYDPNPPKITSGIRLGTPALTTRGMKENDMVYIADLITAILTDIKNENLINETKAKVKTMCDGFPLFAK
ncbi:MAG: serine hydroxymethyltransferase [Desulfobacterales bacterium]|nr:serine hydroxymethyltransferase [Desulfobacterales bacterium]